MAVRETVVVGRSKEKAAGQKKWLAGAIQHPGALRETAKRKGLIKGDEKLDESDLQTLKDAGGVTRERANLAETMKGFKH